MKLSNQLVRRSTKLELSTASMIDVVFLLLVFFLVTSSFNRPEQRLTSELQSNEPSSAGGDLDPAIIDIVATGDQYQYRIGDVVSADLGPIRKVLMSFRNKDNGAFVRVGDSIPFEWPARAISLCKECGFEWVSYLPTE